MTKNVVAERARAFREQRGTWGTHAEALCAEVERLDALINNPHTNDFLKAVKLEAAHQRERWGSDHDGGKTDLDWFWLIGYLSQKAVHAGNAADVMAKSDVCPDPEEAAQMHREKRLHHIITTAAALLNWHMARAGVDNSMRPGIVPPEAA